VGKSNYMLFTNYRTLSTPKPLNIGSAIIEKKQCVKLLGMHLDDKMTWNTHINICKSKISSSIYAIKRLKHILPKSYLRTLYFTMVHPYLTYGIAIWGATYNVHRNKLFILQKRIIRIISGAKYNDHTSPLFQKLHILKLDDIYTVQAAKFVFKYKQNALPLPLQSLFMSNSDIHQRITRQSQDLHVKKCRTTLATHHITCKGPQIWNSLPNYIKSMSGETVNKFTSMLSTHIIQQYSH